jgi:hypothetical protein
MSEWIRVKDRLPEIEKKVLVWDEEIPDPEFVDIGYYDPDFNPKNGWHCKEYMDCHVTHWRPLPKPPEKK